ncbi:MAG: DUF5916 domain-containing protein [Lysobacterales bacterium]
MARLSSAPVIDGVIDDAEWAGATTIDSPFFQFQPDYGRTSPFRTTVRVAQAGDSLVIAFVAWDDEIHRLSATRTSRDGGISSDDSVAVLIDTFLDGRTAYLFRTNPLATQEDARIADNGQILDDRWDAAWSSAARRHEDRWEAEIGIPFSILKFDAGERATWGINFMRTVPRRLEESLWSPPADSIYRVAAFGSVSGLAPPQPTDAWTLIPYAIASYEKGEEAQFEAGGDIRWRPTSRLGIDLTLNPDFALIEADTEEINLSRFELRIEEKRPFFLEGNEMYQQRIEQFYSRRIGDIDWGAKASGKLGPTNFSAIATRGESLGRDDSHEMAEYTVARFQQGFGRGSNIGVLAANRHFLDDNAGSAGLDTSWFFTDTLGLTAQYLQVHGPEADGGKAWLLRPSWDTAQSHFHVRYTSLDENIRDDFNAIGFMRDDDRKEWDTNLRHEFWFDEGIFEQIRPSVNYNRYYSQEDVLRSWSLETTIDLVCRSGWEIDLYHLEEYGLFEKEFRNDLTQVEVEWDSRDGKRISFFYGHGYNFDSDIVLWGGSTRWQINDHWRIKYELTELEQDPDPESDSTTIHLFELLYSYDSNLYAELFVQTNSTIEKETVQAIGVWRFQPPFGSLQLAYQRGTSEQGQVSDQDDTFFTKLAWVF